MRYDPQKSFGYPVLRPNNDDYIKAAIQAHFDIKMNKQMPSKGNIEYNIFLSVAEISAALKQGVAVVVVSATCSKTNTIFKRITNSLSGTFEVNINDFADEVIFDACIVVSIEELSFFSEKFNPEFGHEPFTLQRGSVMAQAHPTFRSFSKEMQRSLGNLFELELDEEQRDNEWRLMLSSDKVKIVSARKLYEQMSRWKSVAAGQELLLNSVLMPAMVEMIDSLRTDPEGNDYRWANVLRHKIDDLHDIDIENTSSTLIAQRIWGHPTANLKRFMEEN